jgi:ribonuclease P protein component
MTVDVPRLKRRSEFLRVAGARQKCAAPGLVLQARPRTGDSREHPFRIGFTVSRKVGNAVARNRARRRLRAAVEAVMPTTALDGYDYVVIGRAATLKRPFTALCEDLETALRRLGAHRRGDEDVHRRESQAEGRERNEG